MTCLEEFMPKNPEVEELRPRVLSDRATEEEKTRYFALMSQVSKAILEAPSEKVVKLEFVQMEPPEKARIFTSIPCGCCGEMVADAKTREHEGRQICMPCFLKLSA